MAKQSFDGGLTSPLRRSTRPLRLLSHSTVSHWRRSTRGSALQRELRGCGLRGRFFSSVSMRVLIDLFFLLRHPALPRGSRFSQDFSFLWIRPRDPEPTSSIPLDAHSVVRSVFPPFDLPSSPPSVDWTHPLEERSSRIATPSSNYSNTSLHPKSSLLSSRRPSSRLNDLPVSNSLLVSRSSDSSSTTSSFSKPQANSSYQYIVVFSSSREHLFPKLLSSPTSISDVALFPVLLSHSFTLELKPVSDPRHHLALLEKIAFVLVVDERLRDGRGLVSQQEVFSSCLLRD